LRVVFMCKGSKTGRGGDAIGRMRGGDETWVLIV
jgi:hypothetical protein